MRVTEDETETGRGWIEGWYERTETMRSRVRFEKELRKSVERS